MDERIGDHGKAFVVTIFWLETMGFNARNTHGRLLTNRWFVIERQVKTKKKAEIQALSSFGFQYITETYLPQKLRDGDWI